MLRHPRHCIGFILLAPSLVIFRGVLFSFILDHWSNTAFVQNKCYTGLQESI